MSKIWFVPLDSGFDPERPTVGDIEKYGYDITGAFMAEEQKTKAVACPGCDGLGSAEFQNEVLDCTVCQGRGIMWVEDDD